MPSVAYQWSCVKGIHAGWIECQVWCHSLWMACPLHATADSICLFVHVVRRTCLQSQDVAAHEAAHPHVKVMWVLWMCLLRTTIHARRMRFHWICIVRCATHLFVCPRSYTKKHRKQHRKHIGKHIRKHIGKHITMLLTRCEQWDGTGFIGDLSTTKDRDVLVNHNQAPYEKWTLHIRF